MKWLQEVLQRDERTKLYIWGQMLICLAVIGVIVFFGNQIYQSDLEELRSICKESEVQEMREVVTNVITCIEQRRSTMNEHVMDLIEMSVYHVGDKGEKDISTTIEKTMDFLQQQKNGEVIQAIYESADKVVLYQVASKKGKPISQKEKEAIEADTLLAKTVNLQTGQVTYFATQEDVDDLTKAEVHEFIHNMTYLKNSYVWVNEVINMEGGDNYAIRRIHPNLKHTEGCYLSTNTQDSHGNYPYETELREIREHGEVVHQYYFQNKSDQNVSEKISYAAYYEPYQWIVATGTPLNQLYSDVSMLSQKRLHRIFLQMGMVSLLMILLLMVNALRMISRLSIATKEAEEASRAKTTFLYHMSHDIRTPMNAIMGFTKIAKKQNTNEEVGKCLEKIAASADHLLLLINDVLDISRVESGTVTYHPEPVCLGKVTASVLEITQGFLSGRLLSFQVKHPDHLMDIYVKLDPIRLREILVNILSNAVKFTNDGGTIGFLMNIYPMNEEEKILVEYKISDTGCGMSKEFQAHVFEEFVQEESSPRTKYKGTGLGMAIAKHYVNMMGGEIKVDSTRGVGTTFTVTLPLELVDQKTREQEDETIRVDLQGKKVLLAEDNDLNAEIAMHQLGELGATLIRVVNGQEAVEAFARSKEGEYDLIIMDIMMPVLDGHEAARQIRAMTFRADAKTVPMIAMTANAFAEDEQASLEAGLNAHVTKPLMMREVMKALARVMKKNTE